MKHPRPTAVRKNCWRSFDHENWVGGMARPVGELGLRGRKGGRKQREKQGRNEDELFAGFRCDGQATAGSPIRYLGKERRERRDKVVDEGQGELQPREFHAFPGEFVTLCSWNCGYNYRQPSPLCPFQLLAPTFFRISSSLSSKRSHERRSFR